MSPERGRPWAPSWSTSRRSRKSPRKIRRSILRECTSSAASRQPKPGRKSGGAIRTGTPAAGGRVQLSAQPHLCPKSRRPVTAGAGAGIRTGRCRRHRLRSRTQPAEHPIGRPSCCGADSGIQECLGPKRDFRLLSGGLARGIRAGSDKSLQRRRLRAIILTAGSFSAVRAETRVTPFLRNAQ